MKKPLRMYTAIAMDLKAYRKKRTAGCADFGEIEVSIIAQSDVGA